MYIAPCDRNILWSNEVRQLKEEYYRRFGEHYSPFNYESFTATDSKCAAEVYIDSLKAALQNNC